MPPLPIKIPPGADFMAQLGHCITQWSRIEEQAYYMCKEILRVTETQCAIIFYRTPTLDTRLGLLDELMRDAFPKPSRKSGGQPPIEIKKWRILLKDIRNETPIRNQLAHQPVGLVTARATKAPSIKPGETVDLPLAVFIASYLPASEIARGDNGKKGHLTQTHLRQHYVNVLALYNRFVAFRSEMLQPRLRQLHEAASSD